MKSIPESKKRYTNSYKCTSNVYNKAMRRAKKEKLKLATLIEVWLICYAHGTSYFIEGIEKQNQ